ncbi:VOC family protein [Sphingomonas sp. 37zxx]|uniref:VOC family protein n=1 Tax=Sphingomonas sp. 37zxx TaxID=1550073 RepID=UPI00053C050E|nr:VOC family protein [Sphingomonas sp. 37zxx]
MKVDAITFFARDPAMLAAFYADALGLETAVDDLPRYCELAGGGTRIGFAYDGAYALSGLGDEACPVGLRSIITFGPFEAAAIEAAVTRAVNAGATVARPPYATHFGRLMAVLRDPEGNAFRLNADLPGESADP